MKPRNIIGLKFGRLTVISFSHRNHLHKRCYKCKCSCGNEKVIESQSITDGRTRSCGCLHDEVAGNRARTHGKSGSATHGIWQGMMNRCFTKSNEHYSRYGGRGITVCERWLKFENFLEDMGERPDGLTIDRIDGNKNYSPDNCRWATWSEQRANQARNAFGTYQGETLCAAHWAKRINTSKTTIARWLRTGRTVEDVALRFGWKRNDLLIA